eukprot:CAMPEP_0170174414 /NCGR_PEP_ID=MMETSP0040_2-20121228/7628_1 /TAXON_ID=641309 /ORGANISM="Lotharella oceanica, Strain CCMP622" /LENGTH=105 /DNA_ID=CAMNT_0010416037 /DNA_START=86 /DNA_END=403 /DNA_ORIENTATION=-
MDDFEAARLILSNFPGCEGTCQTLVNVVAPLVKKHIWDRKLNESTHYMYLKGVPCVRTEHEKRSVFFSKNKHVNLFCNNYHTHAKGTKEWHELIEEAEGKMKGNL